jgi:hypothetical protein
MTLSWSFRSHDILLPADFDGDGMDDLYVVNLDQWFIPYLGMLRSTGSGFEPVQRYDLELPAWDDMRDDDEFYVGDFSGDGKVDLMVFNGIDWDDSYFIMLRSDGANLVYSKRYDGALPGYQMGAQEHFNVTDFNGDGKLDVIAHETQSWGKVHLQLHASTGSKLSLSDRHYGEIGLPATWIMRRGDVLRTPDFNGDAADDLVIFNGDDWIPVYLGLFETTIGGQLQASTRYDDDADDLTPSNAVPGWAMRRGDQLLAANVDGDTDVDLVVYNTLNWKSNFLGLLRSDGIDQLSGSWQANWIGGWNLGAGDGFHVVDFRGAGGWEDLFVYNHGWFGLLRSYSSHYALEAIYRKWIHNHRYHDFGFY